MHGQDVVLQGVQSGEPLGAQFTVKRSEFEVDGLDVALELAGGDVT